MKFGRVGLALLTAAALVAGVLPPKALADSNARIVRLSYVDGEAQIDRRDGRGFEHAFLNMPLGPGTRVSTRDDARAEIEFEDMSTVRLTPGTLVETQSLDLRSSGAKYTLVDLQDGTAYFNIRKRDDDNDFRVTTGRREFSLTRAARFRLRVDRSQVVLAVFAGEIEVVGEGGHLTVRKNETLTLDLDDPARYFLAKGVSSDRYDDWDQERDEYRDRYANVGNYRGYSSAYSYGVSDLNYWGSYTNISGYGYMWRPNYYGVNWNPYANGAWYWYPGYGYIWVSAYPWGWMPFRYGNWYYIGGHGWCWRPGNQWHHWSPVVAVHNPPPGHLMPTPPPPTGRRDPVVVGHGPATILPPEDLGPRRGVRDPNVLGKKGGNPASGGSGGVGTPGSGPGATPSGGSGSGVSAGSGSGGSVGSGGSGQPAADSGRRPSGREREIELEEAIRNARERRGAGGQSGVVITNSGSGSSGSSGGSPTSGGSGAASQGSSPASGRQRVPEPRRQLPPSITNDSPTAGSGSSGSASSGGSGGSSSGSDATSPAADPAPTSGGGRSPEPRREPLRENFMPSSGSSGSAASSTGSSSSGSSSSSSGGSGSASGSSGHSSSPSGSGSSSGHSSSGSSGSSSGGSHASSGSSSAGGHSSSSGRSSSSSSPKSSTSTTPK